MVNESPADLLWVGEQTDVLKRPRVHEPPLPAVQPTGPDRTGRFARLKPRAPIDDHSGAAAGRAELVSLAADDTDARCVRRGASPT